MCSQRTPRSTYPCAEDYPLSCSRLSADCRTTWRINCPPCPNPAFYKGFKGMEGEAGCFQFVCLQVAHPRSLSYILSGFSGFRVCSLPGEEW